jgi:hypothetical protein
MQLFSFSLYPRDLFTMETEEGEGQEMRKEEEITIRG